jgi:hypothetical protein
MSAPDPLTPSSTAPTPFALPLTFAAGPSADPATRFDQMFAMLLQMYTQNAVTQTTLGNLDRRLGTIEHGFDARLKELENARFAELTAMGSMRTELEARSGRLHSAVMSGDMSLVQNAQTRNAALQNTLVTVAVSLFTALLVLLLSGSVRIGH